MHYTLWLFLANISIAIVEYVYRAGEYSSFWEALPWLALPIIISQWALFEGFRVAPSLFLAGAIFSGINLLFRLCNTLILHEHLNFLNWVGVACIAASIILLRVK